MTQEKLYPLMESLGFIKNLPDDPFDRHWYHEETDLLISIPTYVEPENIVGIILHTVGERLYANGRESVMKQMRELIGIYSDGPERPDGGSPLITKKNTEQ